MKSKMRSAFAAAFPKTIPVLTGFFVLGFAYGLLASSKGYNPLWIALYSATAFCGSMQYVAITFMVGAFQPLQVFLLTLMVNARHLFYGLSMLDKYRGTGKFKFFIIYMMCDETFAINSSSEVPDGIEKKHFYFAVSFLDWCYWLVSCVLGGICGGFLAINTKGLDFALTALIVVLFIEQLKSRRNAICGAIGICSALASLLAFGAGNMVIPAMAIIFAALLAGRNKLCG